MEKIIEELRNKCKRKSFHHELTIKDFKVIYYLWNDNTISREKILEELHRHERTIRKIDRFIKEYFENNKIDKIDDELFQRILTQYEENK
jgi:TPP-dependent 2-oxoacid decarboxylase